VLLVCWDTGFEISRPKFAHSLAHNKVEQALPDEPNGLEVLVGYQNSGEA